MPFFPFLSSVWNADMKVGALAAITAHEEGHTSLEVVEW